MQCNLAKRRLASACALALLWSVVAAAAPTRNIATWQVCFVPGEDCTSLIAAEVSRAKRSVLIQAYEFTSASIAKAVADAKRRGIDVKVILDKSQQKSKYSVADFLANSGIPTLIDSRHAIAHNKIIIIDGETVITGSFNFTKSAQDRNAENLLILESVPLASRYIENWKRHAAHAEPYKGRGE